MILHITEADRQSSSEFAALRHMKIEEENGYPSKDIFPDEATLHMTGIGITDESSVLIHLMNT
jgi:hypothetical protein